MVRHNDVTTNSNSMLLLCPFAKYLKSIVNFGVRQDPAASVDIECYEIKGINICE
jgi:hypothetical protein